MLIVKLAGYLSIFPLWFAAIEAQTLKSVCAIDPVSRGQDRCLHKWPMVFFWWLEVCLFVCLQHLPHGHLYHFTDIWLNWGIENKTQIRTVILSKTRSLTRSNIQRLLVWIQPNSGRIVNLIAATLFYSWEDKQGHNYSLNKQVGMMYRIRECAADPLGKEKPTVAFCLWGFKTERLLTPPNKASHQENLIITCNDKFTLCNYLLPFPSSILWGEDSVCAWLDINAVRRRPGQW